MPQNFGGRHVLVTNSIFKPLVIACLVSISVPVLAQPYLYIEGYGKTESQAATDAKQQLALRIYSTVDVSEKNRQVKNNSDVDSYYSLESNITTLPISVQNMEAMKSQCDDFGCNYQFRVNKDIWVDQLSRDINKQHQLVQQYITYQNNDWKSAVFTNKAQTLLSNSHQSILVLSSLNNDVAETFNEQQIVLERNTIDRVQNISISIRSASDMYSSQLKALLTQKIGAASQGDIIIYVKGNVRKGRQNNTFIAKQDLILQVFEARNPNVVVSQKILSEIGQSSTSKEQALDAAHTKITAQLNKNSIYTLLN
ncbi:hypothetical protein [Photobacterium sanguinicancri]|uniref:hypothetical protein n=1 Tax=Photobacterium sanguinicancri TaxID=875932 RepID=UPI001EFE8941|nr:hypothetical protein [Photobacterium sanguinicancri]